MSKSTTQTDDAAAETTDDDSDELTPATSAENPSGFGAIIEARKLEWFLNTASRVVDEFKLQLQPDGLHVLAVDPANVAMIDETLDADAFEYYEADGGVLGIPLEKVQDVVDMAEDDDSLIHIQLDEQTRKLHLQLDNLEVTCAMIDPAKLRDADDIPELDLPARVVLEGDQFKRGIDAASLVSDHLVLGLDPDAEPPEYYVNAEGDTDDAYVAEEQEMVLDMSPGQAESTFSLNYLETVSKSIEDDDAVALLLGDEFPVKIKFSREGELHVTYMIAPRITSDD